MAASRPVYTMFVGVPTPSVNLFWSINQTTCDQKQFRPPPFMVKHHLASSRRQTWVPTGIKTAAACAIQSKKEVGKLMGFGSVRRSPRVNPSAESERRRRPTCRSSRASIRLPHLLLA